MSDSNLLLMLDGEKFYAKPEETESLFLQMEELFPGMITRDDIDCIETGMVLVNKKDLMALIAMAVAKNSNLE
jgi:hypothetical protein